MNVSQLLNPYPSRFHHLTIHHVYQSAYIVNHSKSYTVAALASWTEFWLEYYWFGGSKLRTYVSILGVLMVLMGQVRYVNQM